MSRYSEAQTLASFIDKNSDILLADLDADALLPAALRMADKRVVVKRPDYAGWLNEHKPSMAIETKSNRFDVYVMAALAG